MPPCLLFTENNASGATSLSQALADERFLGRNSAPVSAAQPRLLNAGLGGAKVLFLFSGLAVKGTAVKSLLYH